MLEQKICEALKMPCNYSKELWVGSDQYGILVADADTDIKE